METDGQELKKGLPLAVLVGSDQDHLRDLQTALSFLFRVAVFDNARKAVVRLHSEPPRMVVVDDGGQAERGLQIVLNIQEALARLARDHSAAQDIHGAGHHDAFKDVPIVFCTSSKDQGALKKVRQSGADAVMSWPLNRHSFLATVAGLLRKRVEAAWEDLPPVQKTALKETVQTFRTISDCIEKGEPLPIQDVRESCGPLVDAVQSSEFSGILNGVRNHDDYTYAHSVRVATFLSLFGHHIGIRGEDLLTLASGGLVHDVGKMDITPSILNKPGKLSDEEFGVMKGHVERTTDALNRSDGISLGVRVIAEQHHEKLSGGGYPNNLKGAELNELARMAAIADIFGALTDRRPYKEAHSPEKALEIMESMGGALDQALLKKLRGFIEEVPE